MRRRQETVLPLRRSIDQNSGFTTPRRYLAACYAQLDKDEEAEEQVSKILELEPLQPQAVKGLREPVRAYRAKGVLATSRSEAATALGLSAFVGRQSELQFLLERWAEAKEGEGQVVLLSGEAGIGTIPAN